MNTTTFTATFTFPTENIIGFAKFIGYKEQIQDPSATVLFPQTLIPNPETALEYVARMAKAYNETFVTRWATSLVKEQVQAQTTTLNTQLNTQIIQPIKDAIQVTYTNEVAPVQPTA